MQQMKKKRHTQQHTPAPVTNTAPVENKQEKKRYHNSPDEVERTRMENCSDKTLYQ